MVDFASRPEVTVSTMGKVHNPTGQGVRATSTQVQAKKIKQLNVPSTSGEKKNDDEEHVAGGSGSNVHKATDDVDTHETKVKEGTAKRNISRKKTDSTATGKYDSRNKKQGGHGKAEWKEHLDPDIMDPDYKVPVDKNDPLYDEQEEQGYILSSITTTTATTTTTTAATTTATASSANDDKIQSGNGNNSRPTGYHTIASKAIYGPMLTLSEFKIQVAAAIKEYFDSCDSDEVIRTLLELKCSEYHCEIVKKAISLAMDQGPRERELTSRLLTALHPTPMSDRDMALGFVTLLDRMDDLRTDVPDANTMAASFLARAVVDEVLPPAFLSDQNNDRPGDLVIEKAVSLLSREHCNARLEKVWGPGDGRPVAELKTEMDQLLQEYLMSRELDEAARCVKELEAPHFQHELVKRGVKIAMELDGKNAAQTTSATTATSTDNQQQQQQQHELSNMDAMAALFGFLVRNAIVSEYQVKKGIARLHTLLPDLSLDVPAAPKLLQEFEDMAAKNGLPTTTSATLEGN